MTLTGINKDKGCVEGDLILGKVQGTQGTGEVKDGADELAAAWRSGDERVSEVGEATGCKDTHPLGVWSRGGSMP